MRNLASIILNVYTYCSVSHLHYHPFLSLLGLGFFITSPPSPYPILDLRVHTSMLQYRDTPPQRCGYDSSCWSLHCWWTHFLPHSDSDTPRWAASIGRHPSHSVVPQCPLPVSPSCLNAWALKQNVWLFPYHTFSLLSSLRLWQYDRLHPRDPPSPQGYHDNCFSHSRKREGEGRLIF